MKWRKSPTAGKYEITVGPIEVLLTEEKNLDGEHGTKTQMWFNNHLIRNHWNGYGIEEAAVGAEMLLKAYAKQMMDHFIFNETR